MGFEGKNNYMRIKGKVQFFHIIARACLLLVDSLNTVLTPVSPFTYRMVYASGKIEENKEIREIVHK